MRAKSMNMDDIVLRGCMTFNPRRVQSTFVRGTLTVEDEEDIDPEQLVPFENIQETLVEHF